MFIVYSNQISLLQLCVHWLIKNDQVPPKLTRIKGTQLPCPGKHWLQNLLELYQYILFIHKLIHLYMFAFHTCKYMNTCSHIYRYMHINIPASALVFQSKHQKMDLRGLTATCGWSFSYSITSTLGLPGILQQEFWLLFDKWNILEYCIKDQKCKWIK